VAVAVGEGVGEGVGVCEGVGAAEAVEGWDSSAVAEAAPEGVVAAEALPLAEAGAAPLAVEEAEAAAEAASVGEGAADRESSPVDTAVPEPADALAAPERADEGEATPDGEPAPDALLEADGEGGAVALRVAVAVVHSEEAGDAVALPKEAGAVADPRAPLPLGDPLAAALRDWVRVSALDREAEGEGDELREAGGVALGEPLRASRAVASGVAEKGGEVEPQALGVCREVAVGDPAALPEADGLCEALRDGASEGDPAAVGVAVARTEGLAVCVAVGIAGCVGGAENDASEEPVL
jgi:hypothetical protein